MIVLRSGLIHRETGENGMGRKETPSGDCSGHPAAPDRIAGSLTQSLDSLAGGTNALQETHAHTRLDTFPLMLPLSMCGITWSLHAALLDGFCIRVTACVAADHRLTEQGPQSASTSKGSREAGCTVPSAIFHLSLPATACGPSYVCVHGLLSIWWELQLIVCKCV